MKIESIQIENHGYVTCRSEFYMSEDLLNKTENRFCKGINRLNGEIDSGVWAISYVLSMYETRRKDFTLFESPKVIVNGCDWNLENLMPYTCYMDKRYYPMFSSKKLSVEKLVRHGIRKNHLEYTSDEIRDLFHMDAERFQRPIFGVGNERFRAMAAVGYVHGKEVYCFPWMSQLRFEAPHGHMTDLLDILERLQKIVILPIGY